MSTTCLKTKVRNATGKTSYFGFLPPHGKNLDAGETYEFYGTFDTIFSKPTLRRQRDALVESLENGDLQIVNTPSPIMYDATHDEAKVLQSAGGTVTGVDVCYANASVSLSP